MADNPFPVITLIQSVKLWQKSYFYVKNIALQGDYVNLPAFVASPPAGRQPSWSYWVKSLMPAGVGAVARLRVLIQSERLIGSDLIAPFVEHRVLPLQGRPHLICQMSDRFDPSRLSTKEMPHNEVSYMVNYIANCKLTEEWRYGKEPYSRANPPPVVSLSSFLLLSLPSSPWSASHQSARSLIRTPSFIHRPESWGRNASSPPTVRRTTRTTPTWGRPP